MVEEVKLRVRLIIYSKDFTNTLIGRKGKLSKGGALNLKSNSNTRGKIVSGLNIRPAYSRSRYYSGGVTVPYTISQRSPLSLAPLLILPIAVLIIFPGL